MSGVPLVAGHELPAALVQQVRRGEWPPAVSSNALSQVFGEDPEPSAKLYSLDEMEGETSRWQQEADAAYLGFGDETLEPALSILIGDLGFDRPIGIDLRTSPSRVRLLTIDGRWRLISDSVDQLLNALETARG